MSASLEFADLLVLHIWFAVKGFYLHARAEMKGAHSGVSRYRLCDDVSACVISVNGVGRLGCGTWPNLVGDVDRLRTSNRGRVIMSNEEWRAPPPWLIAIIIVGLYILLSLAFVFLENEFGFSPGRYNSLSFNAPPNCRQRVDLFVGAPD